MLLQTNAQSRVKRLCLCGVLIALAFALSFLESLIPLPLIVPVPGIKLGLANIVTMYAVYYLNDGNILAARLKHKTLKRLYYNGRSAFMIICIRCVLQNLLFGSPSALMFSLCGGLLAMFSMLIMKTCFHRYFSVFGISVCGAACHNIGQIICACVYFKTISIGAYLPLMLLLSIPTGLLTGFIAKLSFVRLSRV